MQESVSRFFVNYGAHAICFLVGMLLGMIYEIIYGIIKHPEDWRVEDAEDAEDEWDDEEFEQEILIEEIDHEIWR